MGNAGSLESLNRRQQIVGRVQDVRTLLHELEIAAQGATRVVLLEGEPGIGKTRLLDWLAEEASTRGATVLWGGASQAEGMPSYLPLLEALGRYIRVTEPGVLREQIGQAASPLVAILPELTQVLGDVSAVYPLPPEQTRLRLFEAVGAFLAAIAGPGPLLLLLDDLQWSDASTLELLCHVTRTEPRIRLLVAGAYRAEEAVENGVLERAIMELTRQRRLTAVRILPLSLQEVGDLAAQHLNGAAEPQLIHLLHEQCEGNPFFAEELLRDWCETGVLVHAAEGWSWPGLERRVLPASVVGAIRQRLNHLEEQTAGYLRAASVIGRTFHISTLASILGQDPEAVEDGLTHAEHASLIQANADGLYTFRHDMIRECLYADVTSTKRQRLHEAIGLVLEDPTGNQTIVRLTDLAFHFARSPDRERGIEYSRRAGDEAMRYAAVKEALEQYQVALQLLEPGDERRGDMLLQVGDAALLAGKEGLATATFTSAQGLLTGRDSVGAGRAAHGLGVARLRQDALVEARLALEAALTLLRGQARPETVRVLVDLATLLSVNLGRQEEGVARGEQALDLARQIRDTRLEAAASRTVGNLKVRGNAIAEGLTTLEQALVLARAANDLAEAAECCACLANACYWIADIERSREYTVLREELARRCQQPYELRHVHTWLAFLAATQGDWEQAERHLGSARGVVEQLASSEPLGFLRQVEGFLSWEQGDYAAAERAFDGAVEIFREHGSGELAWYLGTLGLAKIAVGKQQRGEEILVELEALLNTLPLGSLPTAPALTCAMLMAIRMGDRKRAAQCYSQLRAFEGQLHWFLVDRALASFELMSGDRAAARTHLDRAERSARSAGTQHILAGVIEEQDRLAGGTGEALPAGLTHREVEVLRLVAAGLSNREVATTLHLSANTVAKHLTSIFNKTDSDNRTAAAAFATRHGVIR